MLKRLEWLRAIDEGSGGGATHDDVIDLEALDDAEEPAAAPSDDGEDIPADKIDAWLKKKGYVAYDVTDPRLRRMIEPEARPETDPPQDDSLDALLMEDPSAYAKEVARRAAASASARVGETARLTAQLLRQVQAQVPDLPPGDLESLADQLSGEPPESLQRIAQSGALVTTAKAMLFDRSRGTRPPNQTAGGRVSPGSGSASPPAGLQKNFDMMAKILSEQGIKPEDIASSDYMPRKRK